MSGHTPGPWEVGKSAHGSVWAGDTHVASCDWSIACEACGTESPDYRAGRGLFNPREMRYANARLIAAAPDLLEALRLTREVAVYHADEYPSTATYAAIEAADAAIRKATEPTA